MDSAALTALFDLTGRTAIVTGGTRGIGLAVAHGLAAAGANVVVASRKSDACERAAEQLRQAGAQAIGVPTHLGDVEGIRQLVEATVERFGGVDIVINNAANALALPLGEITPDALSKSFSVNLQGPVFLVQAALPYLRKSEHAAIVNVVSAGAYVSTLTLITGLPEVIISVVKALTFGLIAGLVGCYRGLTVAGGSKGVGTAVNETLVLCVIALFAVNVVLTTIGVKFGTQSG
mgnify:CR=1 FL=1